MDELSYEEFGRRFFELAVTEERVVAGLGGLTQVSASGVVGEGSARRLPGDEVRFRLSIPVELDLDVDLGVDRHRFHADVTIGLDVRAAAAAPLRVVIEVTPPTGADVEVSVKGDTVRAEVLRRVAGIDREISRFVARYVAREIDKPGVKAARDIDVAARIDDGIRRT
jgi:hypothetical protein